MPEQSLPGLDSPAERRFHERYDAVVRVMEWLLYAIVVMVGLGAVGSGPLSWAQTEGDGIVVSYERFTRNGATWTLEVEAQAFDGPLEVTIDRRFHAGQELTSLTPEPAGVSVDGDSVTYEFEPESPGERITIEFRFTADSLWRQHAEVRVGGGSPVSFTQFVYP